MANVMARARPRSSGAALSMRLLGGVGAGWRSVFALRLRGGVGAALGATLVAAFATYRAADPSLNVASADRPHNVMGAFGAALADAGLQTFGLAAWIGALMVVTWGFARAGAADPRLNRSELRVRFLSGVLGMMLVAGVLGAPQPPATWPLARGLGGVFGDALMAAVSHALHLVRLPMPKVLAAGVLALGAGPGAGLWRQPGLGRRDGAVGMADLAPAPSRRRPPRPPGLRPGHRQEFRQGCHARAQARPATGPSGAPPSRWCGTSRPVPGPPAKRRPSTRPSISPHPRTRRMKRSRPPSPSPPTPRWRACAPRRAPPRAKAASGRSAWTLGDQAPVFQLPELAMLAPPKPRAAGVDEASLRQNARMLETVLSEFGVKGQIDHIRPGPVVTLYELVPAAGVKSSRVIALSDRHRPLHERAGLPGVGGVGPQRHRHRAAQCAARDRLPARPAILRRVREARRQPAHGPGRKHRRRALCRRPVQDAPPADRRHHRVGQVGGASTP